MKPLTYKSAIQCTVALHNPTEIPTSGGLRDLLCQPPPPPPPIKSSTHYGQKCPRLTRLPPQNGGNPPPQPPQKKN